MNFNLEGSRPEIKEGDLKCWDEVRFAHRSEKEFARLLDFYDIKWLYEPVSFDIAWDQKGIPVSKFTPDFYLPEYDLYIEITTMNQKLVTKKNRSAVIVAFSVILEMPLSTKCSWKRRSSSAVAVAGECPR